MTVKSDIDWWRPDYVKNTNVRHQQAQGTVDQLSEISDDGSQVAYRALVVFTFILLLGPQQYFPFLGPFRIALLAAFVGILSYVFNRLSQNKPLLDKNPAMTLIIALLCWVVITIPFSLWPGASVYHLLNSFIKTIIVFILLGNIITDVAKLRGISWCLIVISVPLSVVTILNYTAGSFYGDARVMGLATSGLTANPNDMALMLNLILPFSLAQFFSTDKALLKIILLVIIGLTLGAVIFTFSRGGFLGLAFLFMYLGWRIRSRPERIWIPLALCSVIFVIPFIPGSYIDRISTITNIEEDNTGSAQMRVEFMKNAVIQTLKRPVFGSGLNAGIIALNETRDTDTGTQVHNTYLVYALELGLPGFILFMSLLIVCIRNTSYVLRVKELNNERDSLYYISEAIRISLFVFALEGFFHPVSYNFYFFYMGGLSVGIRIICRKEEERSQALVTS